MVAQYILAPDPLWSALKATGVPAANGYVFTYISGTRTYKDTYLDPAGLNSQTNPVRLNTAGEATIYWKVESGTPLYTILVYSDSTVDGVPGQLIASVNNYPNVGVSGGGSVITIYSNNDNFIRNAQFTWWTHGTSFDTTDLIAGDTPIADTWFFRRGNTNADITISQQTFDPETNPPPGTASHYIEYECTSAATDTVNMIAQTFTSVQTKANEEVTVGFWAKTRDAASTSTVSIAVIQYFGVGGSPTPATVLYSQAIDDTWTYYSETFTVPSISGTTIGTGGDDYLLIGLQYQINQVIAIDIVDAAFQPGLGTGIDFPYITQNEQYNNILQDILLGHHADEGTDIIGTGSITTPAAQDETLTEFLQQSFYESAKPNLLIGWNFANNPNQFGQIIVPNNAQYIADQTILLSDGNGIVEKTSFIGANELILEVLQTAKKFGIFQIIETYNSAMIYAQYVSYAALIRSTSTCTSKVALLGWSGTENMQTKNPIQAWNVAGTNPTLSAGWAYIGTPISITSTPSNSYAVNEHIDTAGAYSSFAVLAWNDSADLAIGQSWLPNSLSLNLGQNASSVEQLDFATVLNQCQRYWYRTYDVAINVIGGAVTSTGQNGITLPVELELSGLPPTFTSIFPATSASLPNYLRSSSYVGWVQFPQTMYKLPVVTTYNPVTGGTSSGYLNVIATGSPTAGSQSIAASQSGGSETGFNIVVSANTLTYNAITFDDYPLFYIHYVANATLGV